MANLLSTYNRLEPKGHSAFLIAVAALGINGCSPHREGASSSKHATPQLKEANRILASCSPETLSCGHQKPVISDGIHPFVNLEMGLSALFPKGVDVCQSRSGDAPRGFYALYGTANNGCPEGADIHGTVMGIYSSWNSEFQRSVRQIASDYPPLPRKLARLVGIRSLSIPGLPSPIRGREVNGAIEIDVMTLAGKTEGAARGAPPAALYVATLQTRQERLAQDLAMFRAFVDHLRVGIPAREARTQSNVSGKDVEERRSRRAQWRISRR